MEKFEQLLKEWNWKYKQFEIRFTKLTNNNLSFELVKWTETKGLDELGLKKYCFVLAYWIMEDEGYELQFVCDRPFEFINSEEIKEIWNKLTEVQVLLNVYYSKKEEYRNNEYKYNENNEENF